MDRIKEIEKRLAEIQPELENEEADLDALEQEIKELKEERTAINAKIEKRKALIDEVAEKGEVVKTFEKEERKKETMEIKNRTQEEILASPEYRNGYLKRLMGRDLNDVEKRSIAATNVGGAMPTETSNQIFTKMREIAPLLNEVTLFNVPGNLKFGAESTNNAAAIHTENAEMTGDTDTLATVSLGGYEIVKLVRISATVSHMTVPSFEAWLVDILAENIATAVENYLINGTGSSQPTGIDYFRTWSDGSNAVGWAAASPTIAELREQVSYLSGGYYRKAKWLVNHGTFWANLQANRDDSTHKFIELVGDKYYMMGKEVLFSDYVRDGDLFLGDYSKIVANFSQSPEVKSSADSGFAYNAVDYRAACLFDCDCALSEAFVKGAATLTAGA